jgi:hypothetical protein
MAGRFAIFGVVGVGLGAACADVIGIEHVPPGEVTPAIVHAHPECAECEDDHCSAHVAACEQDASCAATYACLAACARLDADCRRRCESSHPPNARAAELDACRREGCVDACYGVGGLLAPLAGPACSDCFDLACQEETYECLLDGACERSWWCMQDGPVEPPSRRGCLGLHERPDTAREKFQSCRNASCESSCPWGENWECVGQFEWPAPSEGSVPYDLFVKEASSGPYTYLTIADVAATACAADDCAACARPLDSGVSPENGAPVSLALPAGFSGCFELRQDELIEPTLLYLGRPLIAYDGRVTVGAEPPLDAELQTLLGVELDPERGQLEVHVFDCRGDRAPDVVFELDATDRATVPFYMQNSFWPEIDALATRADGRGGFFNVAPGTRTVVARSAGGTVVGSATVEVRAGWVTLAYIHPATR